MKRIAVLFLAAASLAALAQEKKAPTEAEAMAAWVAAGSPGDPHKVLARFAGSWTTKTKVFPGPGAPAMESAGSAECKLILGGRFLESQHTGSMMGMPFEGRGLDGYDNFRKRYVGTWTDNMTTAIIQLTGQLSADGKTLTYEGTMDEPATGEKDKVHQFISRFISENEIHFSIVVKSTGFKMMEMTYTRKS
jgi:Protein of unknown function (DUF1579)